MSTESGLPDFRSKDRGLWDKFNPDELANVQALYNNKDALTALYQERLGQIQQYQAHTGHKILAEWGKNQISQGMITQNVGGFHQSCGAEEAMERHATFR